MMANDTLAKFKDCDILIRPQNMGNFGMFSLNSIDSIFDLGYTAAKKALASYGGLQTDISITEQGSDYSL